MHLHNGPSTSEGIRQQPFQVAPSSSAATLHYRTEKLPHNLSTTPPVTTPPYTSDGYSSSFYDGHTSSFYDGHTSSFPSSRYNPPADPSYKQRPPRWQQTTQPQTQQPRKSPFNAPPEGNKASPEVNIVTQTMAQMVMSSVRDSMTQGSAPMPALYAFFPSARLALRQYFKVSHQYVFMKLLVIIFPFPHLINLYRHSRTIRHHRSSISPSTAPVDLVEDDSVMHATSTQDSILYTADLYIPLMALITYVLLFGLAKGATNEFQPDLLGHTATFASSLLLLEVLITKAAYYLTSADTLPILDLLAYSGYKYVHLVLIVAFNFAQKLQVMSSMPLPRSANFDALHNMPDQNSGVQTLVEKPPSLRLYPFIYWGVFVYFTSCAIIDMLVSLSKSLKTRTATELELTVRPSAVNYVALVVAILQLPLCWLLIPPLYS